MFWNTILLITFWYKRYNLIFYPSTCLFQKWNVIFSFFRKLKKKKPKTKGSLPIVSPVVLEFHYPVNCNSSWFWRAITIPCPEDEYSICKRGWRLLGWLLDSSHQNLFLSELSQEPSEISRFTFIFFRKSFQMFLSSTALNPKPIKTAKHQLQKSKHTLITSILQCHNWFSDYSLFIYSKSHVP